MVDIWAIYRKRCPKCDSKSVDKVNKYRKKWFHNKGKWILKEQRLMRCKECKHTWWE